MMLRLVQLALIATLTLSARAADIFLWHRDAAGDFERVVLEVTPEYVLGFDALGMPEMQAPSAGSGDVVGPASAVTGRIAIFDGITGKLLVDGGSTIANVLSRANHTGTQLISTISDAGALASLSSVASATITDGSIVNADINSAAAIALSKLATDPLARANHTGTQAAGTITGLATSATTDTSDAANIISGLMADARLSANVPLKNAANTFSAANTISANGAASTPALSLTGTVFTGGTSTSTKPSLLVEPAGTTSNAWSTSGTLLGLNGATGFTGKVLSVQKNAVESFYIDFNGGLNFGAAANNPRVTGNGQFLYLTEFNGAASCSYAGKGFNGTSTGTFGWASGSDPAATADAFFMRDTTAIIQQGVDSATPITQTFKGPDARAGTDTNTVGGVMNLASGRGTGTAAGGVLNLQTSAPTTTGTAAGTLTTRVAISDTAITSTLPEVNSTNGAASTPALLFSGSPFTGGTGTSTQPLQLFQATGTTAKTDWSTSGTILGINAPSGFAGNYAHFGAGGAANGIFLKAVAGGLIQANYFTCVQELTLSSDANAYINFGAAGDITIGREAAAIFQQGKDSATPITQTLKAPDARAGTDTNTVGGRFNSAAGRGTGTGAGGDYHTQTSAPTTTGTAAGTLTTREYFYGGEKSMTESSATTLVNIAFGTGKYIGGTLTATTHADDATDFQANTEHFTFSAVNKAGTVTAVMQATPSTSTTAASAGTLTTAWTIVNNGASVDIKNNAVSSLTQTTLKVSYQLSLNTDAGTTITP